MKRNATGLLKLKGIIRCERTMVSGVAHDDDLNESEKRAAPGKEKHRWSTQRQVQVELFNENIELK